MDYVVGSTKRRIDRSHSMVWLFRKDRQGTFASAVLQLSIFDSRECAIPCILLTPLTRVFRNYGFNRMKRVFMWERNRTYACLCRKLYVILYVSAWAFIIIIIY